MRRLGGADLRGRALDRLLRGRHGRCRWDGRPYSRRSVVSQQEGSALVHREFDRPPRDPVLGHGTALEPGLSVAMATYPGSVAGLGETHTLWVFEHVVGPTSVQLRDGGVGTLLRRGDGPYGVTTVGAVCSTRARRRPWCSQALISLGLCTFTGRRAIRILDSSEVIVPRRGVGRRTAKLEA